MIDKHNENLVKITQEKMGECYFNNWKSFSEKENVDNLVSHLLHEIYAFNHCDVLFKPTLAKDTQFRSTKEEFISYFLGQNKICIEDKGFAIKNWKSIKFENYKIIEHHNYLLSVGNYFFENQEKELLKVEYTFGFIKDK